jgi:putative endonuclease
MYFTYVLYSRATNRIYIGSSSDIVARLKAHNHQNNRGWTKKYQPWEIIYQESFLTRKDAFKRERELKSSRGRNYIHSMIQ